MADVGKSFKPVFNFSPCFHPFFDSRRFYCAEGSFFEFNSSEVDEFKVTRTWSESYGEGPKVGLGEKLNWSCQKNSLSMDWAKMAYAW